MLAWAGNAGHSKDLPSHGAFGQKRPGPTLCSAGDAPKGVNKVLDVLQERFPDMQIGTLSGNYCVDKKPSAMNWLEGRGKSIVAEAVLSNRIVQVRVDVCVFQFRRCACASLAHTSSCSFEIIIFLSTKSTEILQNKTIFLSLVGISSVPCHEKS